MRQHQLKVGLEIQDLQCMGRPKYRSQQVSHAKGSLLTLIHSSGKRLHNPEGTWLDTLGKMFVNCSSIHQPCLLSPHFGKSPPTSSGVLMWLQDRGGDPCLRESATYYLLKLQQCWGWKSTQKIRTKGEQGSSAGIAPGGRYSVSFLIPPNWDEGRLWLGSHSVPGVGEGLF